MWSFNTTIKIPACWHYVGQPILLQNNFLNGFSSLDNGGQLIMSWDYSMSSEECAY